MNAREIEAEILKIIDQCAVFDIPRNQLNDMRELAKAGECAVSLENLCTQLYEYDAVLPPALLQDIARLSEVMRVDESYWRVLATQHE